MSRIYLIRHGQASFGTDDYDRLSALGRVQAQRTGEYFRRCRIELDAVYSGGLRRQQDSARLAMAELDPDVDVKVDSRFDEIRNDEQFEHLAPVLAEKDPELSALLARSHTDSKSYQKVLSAVFEYWVTNDCSGFGIQTWGEYQGGVRKALDDLMEAEGSGRTVALFSSGGTIATIAGMVLGLRDAEIYRFYEPMHNCAISQLVYSRDRVSLASFNDTAFLRLMGSEYNEELVSYR